MLEYKNEINDFNELEYLVWGQAVKILEEIYDADKEDELMEHLAMVFDIDCDAPTLTEINDYIAYDWEEIYDAIGIEY
jgi:hypothetical protein